MIRLSVPQDTIPKVFAKKYKSLQTQGILGECKPRPTFDDDPQFFIYTCEYLSPNPEVGLAMGYGSSMYREEAIIAAIAEAVEHYCLLSEERASPIHASYAELEDKAVSPSRFSVFTESQLSREDFALFRFTDHSRFHWIEARSLQDDSLVYVPEQLVFANYNAPVKGEPIIRFPISTGSACGLSTESAIIKGICEVIERDAYMISYLNNLTRPIVEVSDNPVLEAFARRIGRYNLELHLVETTFDLSPTAITAVLIDRTGVGPAVTVGMGASLDPQKAILSAGLEAIRRNIFIRERSYFGKYHTSQRQSATDEYAIQKQKLWSAPHMIQKIQSFIQGAKKPFRSLKGATTSYAASLQLQHMIAELRDKGLDAYWVDITLPEVAAVGFRVVKVLIPDLFPLYLDDRYPYRKNWRLYHLSKELGLSPKEFTEQDLNLTPHPF